MATDLKTPELSRNAAEAFADRWKGVTEEKQYADSFWSDFFRTLCGVEDELLAGIERQKRVKSSISGNQEYIDVYWKNVALIEHKSAGLNLDKAELQARGYWLSLPPGYRPKTIIISDFKNFRLIDVALNRAHEFPLSKLPENIHRFEAIISGNRTRISQEEITVDQEAARLMANLYLELESHGFEGHETSVFLIRILFLLFGDDTGMWAKNTFLKFVMETKEDGSDVGANLDSLFSILDTPLDKRSKVQEQGLGTFPYVNGGIFAEKISVIEFNKKMRVALVAVANYDWTTINPTIFGSLFQLIKNKEARRELGEHYTTEENINKIVYPLFLDDLQERLAASWDSKKELKKLRQDLAKIKIFDPACGCGNFLVVSYRHLRQLELELIVRLNNLEGNQDSLQLDGSMGLSVTLDQFYGIEVEEWPAQVARMALFLTDHQENQKLARVTGETQNRFPIKNYATIVLGNALRLDWDKILKIDEDTYILGNPPFIGMSLMSAEQQADNRLAFEPFDQIHTRTGRLDYVACWYAKAISYVRDTMSQVAFVSTNSITQGEQARTLAPLFAQNHIKIDFAHQTFKWTSEASGAAAVHVVIIGFSDEGKPKECTLFEYSLNGNTPKKLKAKHINFYLIDGPDIELVKLNAPLVAGMPNCTIGSKPADGGNLFVDDSELHSVSSDPTGQKYLRRFFGATELLYNKERWCLWMVDASPVDLRKSKVIQEKLKLVAEMRSKSPTKSVREKASTPHLFTEIRQPSGSYIGMPCVSSENREYIPANFFNETEIAGNGILTFPNAENWVLAYLESKAFTNWVETFSGRLKSDFQILPAISYFTFPFVTPTASLKVELGQLADELIVVRNSFPEANLADLYDPLTMPASLRSVHKKIDAKIDSYYGLKGTVSKSERLRALLEHYNLLLNIDKLV
jgi:hypothetical protein